ncbi:hypothetical protein PQR05_29255 [Paraburkholderia sediminicola]|uniref:hypothetical protein n=1 Tax=Paraburkholderia sediminicola TaxID=458836 RepID=UPI0038BDD772
MNGQTFDALRMAVYIARERQAKSVRSLLSAMESEGIDPDIARAAVAEWAKHERATA